jgi:hypothetical protein
MAIIINNPNVQPALAFDHLHVNHFTYSSDAVQGASRATEAMVTPYAVDATGKFVFDPVNTFKAATGDFDSLAVQAWLTANPGKTQADAQAAYVAARAAVQAQYAAGIDVFTLMAYFELAIGVAIKMTAPATAPAAVAKVA